MARGRMPLSFSTRTGVASALLLDDDTVRDWYRAYERGGVEGLKSVGHEGSNGRLERSVERVGRRPLPAQHREDLGLPEADLWGELRPLGADRSAASPGLRLSQAGGHAAQSRRPRQQTFVDEYENLLNTMSADQAAVFVDAVHPTHQVRPVRWWAPKEIALAVEQTTGRDRGSISTAPSILKPARRRFLRSRKSTRRASSSSWARSKARRDASHPRLRRQRPLSQG